VDKQERFAKDMAGKYTETIQKPGRLYFRVDPAEWPAVAGYLFRDLGCRLSTATAQETWRGLEIIYHFSDDASGFYFNPRLVLPKGGIERLPSVAPQIKGAEWIEREMAEYWGITFEGHPDPRPLLTRDAPESLRGAMRLRRRA
jgi:Ni,Fe-hydrogenase III component G